ncbi:helix-turn-helix domain-containing protein [Phenylobacterium sp. VNQ135]|uniref:helix-turn-helix domain-containing protein n=1 Tax=Phenylobacterium sp. VNQ135 TaxID=3400922 RepID=UPI003C0956D2
MMTRQPSDHRDPVDVAVGARIRLARKMCGQSQQALAMTIGVSFQQVQKYERGANRVSASMLVRIAAALGVSVVELFGPVEAASRISDDIATMLSEPGALNLLRAYCRLPLGYKAAVVSFVEALSEPQGRVS